MLTPRPFTRAACRPPASAAPSRAATRAFVDGTPSAAATFTSTTARGCPSRLEVRDRRGAAPAAFASAPGVSARVPQAARLRARCWASAGCCCRSSARSVRRDCGVARRRVDRLPTSDNALAAAAPARATVLHRHSIDFDATTASLAGSRIAITGALPAWASRCCAHCMRARAARLRRRDAARGTHRRELPGTHGIAATSPQSRHAPLALHQRAPGASTCRQQRVGARPGAARAARDTDAKTWKPPRTNLVGPFGDQEAARQPGGRRARTRRGRARCAGRQHHHDAAVTPSPGWGPTARARPGSRTWAASGRGTARARRARARVRPRRHGTPLHAQRCPSRPGRAEAPGRRGPQLLAFIERRAPARRSRHEGRDRAGQRPRDARLLVVDARGRIGVAPRARLADFCAPATSSRNDAARCRRAWAACTERSGLEVEVRLAGRRSLAADDVHAFRAIVFGAGDTAPDRAAPGAASLRAGDALVLGPLRATVRRVLGTRARSSSRCTAGDAVWAASRARQAVQYAHVPQPLALWDVWTRVAACCRVRAAVAGSCSTGRVARLARTRRRLRDLDARGRLSSTGDAARRTAAVRRAYLVPATTVAATAAARRTGAA